MHVVNKEGIARIACMISKICPWESNVDYLKSREILSQYSLKPQGHCYVKNEIDIKYDLQIIIPVYNVEQYIEKCLSSTASLQTSGWSVLIQIIDDGSTDSSGSYIDQFSRSNKENVLVVHQENKGLSGARNTGLNLIRGRYITFLDSDDLLPEDFDLNTILLQVEGNDVLQGDWEILDSQGCRIGEKSPRTVSGYAWGKYYSHILFENLHFPEGYWFEDTIVQFIINRIAQTKKKLDMCVYRYRVAPNSITEMAKSKPKVIDTYWITELCLEELPKFGIEYDQESLDCLLHQSIVNQMRIRKIPRKIRKAVFSLTVELIEKHFERVNSEKYKELEAALRNRQFCRFELLAIANALQRLT